jgi:hypothetical protein
MVLKFKKMKGSLKISIKYIDLRLLGPNFIEIGNETKCQDESSR